MSKIDITKEKVLFRCYHADELTAYKMTRNKEEITPDNAPICDLELALIANPESPYGFTAISKDNKGEWEYMGFGHSGACSIVTALLKELQIKKHGIEILKTQNLKYKQVLEKINNLISKLDESTECSYGDFDCDNCDDINEKVVCSTKLRNLITAEIENVETITAPTTIFDKIRSFDSDTFAKFIHSLIKCSENLTCDDCYIATLPFHKRICDTKEIFSDIQNWLNEEFKE